MRHEATRLIAGLALLGVLQSPMHAHALRLWDGVDDTAATETYTYVDKDADEECYLNDVLNDGIALFKPAEKVDPSAVELLNIARNLKENK